MHRRIKEIRKALGLYQADFATKIGLSQTALSMIEVGQNAFTDKNIKMICFTFNVSERWLRTGKGNMFNSSPYAKEITDIMESLTPETQQYLLLMAQELLKIQETLLNRSDDGDAPNPKETA